LSLEGLVQPSIGVGASQFGAAIGGGVAFQFGDMLGDHTLTTAIQIDSGAGRGFDLKNTAAQVAYINSARRWNWGIVGGQVPYLNGGYQSGIDVINNEPVQVDQQILLRQTEQSIGGLVAYPFNRARRVEFQGGLSRISFDQIVQTTAFSLTTGQLLADNSDTTRLADPLLMTTTSAALVFDTSNFGATSPVQGQRYRLEASPTFGSVHYTGLLADYRRYFMPFSFYTLATRAMHYGRYGAGGEDPRLQPLFLGYPNLVRGYDVGTFQAADCLPTAASACPAFDRLVGSRLLLGNVEFRFPLLRPFGASQRMYGPVPVEFALFADGGVAWNRGESPSFLGGSRAGVGSAGVAFRVNVFGFAVAQFDIAHPFQRATGGWVYQFSLSPGF
jgi:outer membrane protein assembly factor BamA